MIIYDRKDKVLSIPTGLGNLNSVAPDYENTIRQEGYDDGYSEGYETGNEEGFTEGKTEGYNQGVEVGRSEGYDDGYSKGQEEGVADYVETLPVLDITANGTYDTPNKGVNVNVQMQSYRYMDGGVDESGLRAIGWDDESIGMFRDNVPHYSWQDSDYVVSEENKALYGVLTNSNMADFKNNENMVYAPYFEGTPTSFIEWKYLRAIPKVDTSNVTDMNNMFAYCSKLATVPLFDTSNVTTMRNMFYHCTSLTTVPQFDTSSVTNMESMFDNCSKLTTVPQFDTSNATTMYEMFQACDSLVSVPLLDTSNVTTMYRMFSGCNSLESVALFDTSNVTNMYQMFYVCSKLTTVPQFNTSNVTDMDYMFGSCSKLTTVPLLDTSNVTNMGNMFSSCSSLVSLPEFNVPKVTKINVMFGYGNINSLTDVGGWKNLKCNWDDNYGLAKLPNLTYESCINILNGLYDFTGNGETPTTSQAKLKVHANFLTAVGDELSIGTNKGWTITA